MTEDWQPGLAATKVQPPVPPRHLVQRSRLDDALDAAVDAQVPLVLVSAPAGSGKSTLLAAWLATRPEAVAWLQVEEPDSDPARFWSYLVRAMVSTCHRRPPTRSFCGAGRVPGSCDRCSTTSPSTTAVTA